MRDVHSQKILEPVAVNAENVVDGAGHDSALLVLHLVVDGVEPDDRIDILETAVAPGLDFRPDLVRNVAYGFRRDGASVVFLDEAADVPGTLALGIQADNLVGQAFRRDGFALLDDLGFEGAVPVPRGFDFHGAVLALDCLTHFPVAPVLAAVPLVFCKMVIHLGIQSPVQEVLQHEVESPVLAEKRFSLLELFLGLGHYRIKFFVSHCHNPFPTL